MRPSHARRPRRPSAKPSASPPEQAERDAAELADRPTIDFAAAKSDQDILAASEVAALDSETDALDEEARNKQHLLNKVRLRLSDYE